MKYSCEVIKDLLPLYVDGVCSDESAKAVKEHLDECSACNEMYNEMKEKSAADVCGNKEDKKIKSFKLVKNALRKKTLKKIIIVAATSTAAVFVALMMIYNLTFAYPAEIILDTEVKEGMLKLYTDGNMPGEFEFCTTTSEEYGEGEAILVITAKHTLAQQINKESYSYVPANEFAYPLTRQAWEKELGDDFEEQAEDMASAMSYEECVRTFGVKSVLPFGDIKKVYYSESGGVTAEYKDDFVLIWSSEE